MVFSATSLIKSAHYFKCFLMSILIVIIVPQVFGQDIHQQQIKAWQGKLDAEFKDKELSPLNPKDLKKFKGLEYFPIDPKYQIEALLIRTPNEPPFTMATTTERQPIFTQFGIAIFTIDEITDTLHIYQSFHTSLSTDKNNFLFAPFTDQTSGIKTYGGGRYLDLDMPTDPKSGTILLDFNKAYNPYCAYNSSYSCPIPPRENDLALEIKAGVIDWQK